MPPIPPTETQPASNIGACTCHTMQNTAWLADQPASLAGFQIRLNTLSINKSLSRCPAFVHTPAPPFRSKPHARTNTSASRNLCSAVAITQSCRTSGRKCHHSLQDVVWITVAGYDVGKPRRDPTSHPKLIVRARQKARRSRIRLCHGWLPPRSTGERQHHMRKQDPPSAWLLRKNPISRCPAMANVDARPCAILDYLIEELLISNK